MIGYCTSNHPDIRDSDWSYTSDTRQSLCWCLILYETRSGLSEPPERSGRSHCLQTHKRERLCLVCLVRPKFQSTRLYSYLWILIGLPSPPHGNQDSRSLQTETNWHLQALATRSCGLGCAFYDPASLQANDCTCMRLVVAAGSRCLRLCRADIGRTAALMRLYFLGILNGHIVRSLLTRKVVYCIVTLVTGKWLGDLNYPGCSVRNVCFNGALHKSRM